MMVYVLRVDAHDHPCRNVWRMGVRMLNRKTNALEFGNGRNRGIVESCMEEVDHYRRRLFAFVPSCSYACQQRAEKRIE